MASLAREAESCIWSERFFEDILRAHSISDEVMDTTHTRLGKTSENDVTQFWLLLVAAVATKSILPWRRLCTASLTLAFLLLFWVIIISHLEQNVVRLKKAAKIWLFKSKPAYFLIYHYKFL